MVKMTEQTPPGLESCAKISLNVLRQRQGDGAGKVVWKTVVFHAFYGLIREETERERGVRERVRESA